jgi:hypothetical protein
MRHLILVAALCAPALAQTKESGNTTAPISAKTDDEEGVPKLSLPTESDRLAWLKSGFRLGLGLAYGELSGLRGPPSGRLLGAQLHAGLRLDADWSILASFQYASVSKSGGLSGLRFAGTIDPTWHITPRFSLAVGFGFGGIVEGNTGRADVMPYGSTLDTTYTFPDAKTPLPSCSGVGAAGLVRAEYQWVLGPRSATSVAFEVIGQYTACVNRTGNVEPDTATPIERHQSWAHAGATVAWGITWR